MQHIAKLQLKDILIFRLKFFIVEAKLQIIFINSIELVEFNLINFKHNPKSAVN